MIHASPPDCLTVNNTQNHKEANGHEVNNKYVSSELIKYFFIVIIELFM